jgi:subfamily B ATP-binding cassette protein HlyB/CyaB
MVETGEATAPADPAAASLAFLLQLLGVPAAAADILHHSGKSALDAGDLVRIARRYPVKARFRQSSLERLSTAPLPALARLQDGGWLVLGRVSDATALVQAPGHPGPQALGLADFAALWDGGLLLVTRRAPLSDPHGRFGLGWFLEAIRKYRRPLGEVLVGSLFVQLFGLLAPLFFQVVIDKVFVHRGLSTLEVLAAGLAALSVFEVVLSGIRTYVLAHTSNRIDVELGARLFRHLFALPMAYFQARRVGDTIARVREVDTIRQFLTSSAITLTIDLAFALLFLVVLVLYSPRLTLIVALALPLYAVLSLAVTPSFRGRLQERFQRGSANQSFLVESVAGVETIKSMALEPVMQRRWEEQLAAYVTASFRVTTLSTAAGQIAAALNKLTAVGILFFGAQLVIDNRLTIGELVAFNMIAAQLASPVLRIAQLWQEFQQLRISVERVGDILNTPPEPAGEAHAGLPPIRGDIRLENVGFRYRVDGPPVLQQVSLQVPAGQVIGIVGASGSGKSTLAKLIQRLYVPDSGRVLVDGVDLNIADPAWLRRQIGVVLQDSVLFNRSVRENIALADPGAPMERVITAAQLAGAHEFILGLPEGYGALIGERGATLSGGQRQRIAIARALIGDPRILIFDEATSALDYESEAAVQANMRQICRGRTVIIIAHRLSTVRAADRIVTLERGQIVEDGPHAALLAAGGRYAQLWALQAGEPFKPTVVAG